MNSINGFSVNGQNPQPHLQREPLSDELKAQAQEIISKYDAQNMSEDDKTSMREELHEAGIGRSRELKTILQDEGFEVKGPPKKHARPAPSSETAQPNQDIADFLEKYESGNLTDQDIDSLVELLRKSGLTSSGVVVDETA